MATCTILKYAGENAPPVFPYVAPKMHHTGAVHPVIRGVRESFRKRYAKGGAYSGTELPGEKSADSADKQLVKKVVEQLLNLPVVAHFERRMAEEKQAASQGKPCPKNPRDKTQISSPETGPSVHSPAATTPRAAPPREPKPAKALPPMPPMPEAKSPNLSRYQALQKRAKDKSLSYAKRREAHDEVIQIYDGDQGRRQDISERAQRLAKRNGWTFRDALQSLEDETGNIALPMPKAGV